MSKKVCLVLVLALCVLSAYPQSKSSKKKNSKTPPEWVENRPVSPFYYIGVAVSPKTKKCDMNVVHANAQKLALNDLSSQITVNIESNSVLSTLEIDNEVNESYLSQIKLQNNQFLEDYELVDTWESKTEYWVYYRLSKDDFARKKAEKKLKTIADAKAKFVQAQEFEMEKKHYNAFNFYTNALTALSSYLNEGTPTKLDEQEVDLGTTIISAMIKLLSELKVTGEMVTLKRGSQLDNNVEILLTDKQGNPVAHFPMKLDFSASGLMSSSANSDEEGLIHPNFKKISSSNERETLTITVDKVNLSRLSTDDFVRSCIKKMPMATTSVDILIERPTLAIISSEKSLGIVDNSKPFAVYFTDNLAPKFDIVKGSADYVLRFSSNTVFKEKDKGQFFVTLQCQIVVTDAAGRQVFSKKINQDYAGKTQKDASKEAYQDLTTQLDRLYTNMIVKSMM